jgi:hypothetical protein
VALQGTIEDFALPDIFQLIGLQRKTGILVLTQGPDTVTIKFLEGRVVEADTASQSLEDRLGSVLVRTSRITQSQLDEALKIQRNTLQRLGHILVKRDYISTGELVDALMVQSSQVLYRLFRWREGSYHFDAVEELDYDHNHSTPISSETILMEGARMVDEWPIIERRIPSDKIVLRKTEAAEQLDINAEEQELGSPDPAQPEDFELEFQVDLDLQPQGPHSEVEQEQGEDTKPNSAIKLSAEDRQVLQLVNGERTVREIVDLLPLAEFETFRSLSEMLTRQLVEHVKVERGTARNAGASRNVLSGILVAISKIAIAGLSLGALATLPSNPYSPWSALEATPTTERMRLFAAMARLEKIEKAVQVFYLDSGIFPENLTDLVQYGYLHRSALQDPWGRPYEFRISAGGYQLLGWDAAGQPGPELTISRTFSAVQRMMLSADVAQASP